MSENAGIKMARDDVKFGKEIGKDVYTQGSGDEVFLTAGCMLPFSEENFIEQLENASQFQGYATSGSILHHFVEVKLEPEELAKYIDKIFQKPINYITITTTLAVCQNCGKRYIATDGVKIDKCTCGSDDIATYSRVIGYVKAISRKSLKKDDRGIYEGDYNFWSKARRLDWAERERFTEKTFKEVLEDEATNTEGK
jgi:ribonucleoside-triphosphate reductase